MRIGILGFSPAAVVLANKIIELGARPVIFGDRIPPILTREIFTPMWERCQQLADIYDYCSVVRFGKKHLGFAEEIAGHSRLLDLFQVTYMRDPKQGVLRQVKENPEIFKKLGEEVLTSLEEPIEVAEDVDIIVDARQWWSQPGYLGVRGEYALNEQKWGQLISYDLSFLEQDSPQEITVVLDPEFSSIVTQELLKRWDDFTHINIVKSRRCLLPEIEEREQQEWQLRSENFQQQINSWKMLEDYEKAKVPRPIEPEHKVTIFEDYTIISVDKLLDRDKIFLTCERPSFRGEESLKTVGSDFIWCLKLQDYSVTNELGMYVLRNLYLEKNGEIDIDSLNNDCQNIVNSCLKFFSKVEE